jgi:DNA (cytosine-5)-methyltransferase 1
MTLTVGSLFSGIGGLDLGLERAGMQVIWQSEIDPFACKVLKKHWPEVPNYGDIKQIDWATVTRPNVICGGYPCQPFSTAGKRRGTDDPRHLWPWVRTAISELRPDYAILENVQGHLTMGGLQVIGELAEIGYDAEWRIVSAAGMGAPHRRNRLIIVAYPNSQRLEGSRPEQQATGFTGSSKNSNGFMADANNARGGTPERRIDGNGPTQIKRRQDLAQFGAGGRSTSLANSTGKGLEGPVGQVNEGIRNGFANGGSEMAYTNNSRHIYAQVEKQPDIGRCSKESGQLQWETEPDVGRVANGVSNRVDKLRGLGNAVVPQVAEYIGRLVMAAHNNS